MAKQGAEERFLDALDDAFDMAMGETMEQLKEYPRMDHVLWVVTGYTAQGVYSPERVQRVRQALEALGVLGVAVSTIGIGKA